MAHDTPPPRGGSVAARGDEKPDGERGSNGDATISRGETVGHDGRRGDYRPGGTDARTGLLPTLKRTFTEFSEDNMTDWAAALTYYGVLSIFPAIIALVSIVGLFADPKTTSKTITDVVSQLGPKSAASTFSGPIQSLTSHRSAAGIMFVVGLLLALNAASGYIGAFMRASTVIYETPEGRPVWKLKPLQIGVTLVMVLLFALVIVAVVLTGPVVSAVAGPLGIGTSAQTVWSIAKWPVLLVIVVLMFAVLYHAAPNVKLPGFTWVTPGAAVAIVIWILASVAFAFYVANFGSYDKTYGALGSVVVVLVWFWITNIALLLGMELNAERERSREIDAGLAGAEREIQLEPRDTPKPKKTT